MILTLPYPPSNNRYYRHFRGRTVIGTEGRGYRLAVLDRVPREVSPIEGRIRMRIEVIPNRSVSQDLDNVPKAVCDALQYAKVYANDSQIDDLHILRRAKTTQAKPYLIVTLEAA